MPSAALWLNRILDAASVMRRKFPYEDVTVTMTRDEETPVVWVTVHTAMDWEDAGDRVQAVSEWYYAIADRNDGVSVVFTTTHEEPKGTREPEPEPEPELEESGLPGVFTEAKERWEASARTESMFVISTILTQ